MTKKEIIRIFRRWLARQILYFCSLIIKVLPKRLLYRFAEMIAMLAYYLAVRQRRTALDSLSLAFGEELDQDKKIRIAKDCYRNIAKSGLELLYIIERPEDSKMFVSIEGKEHLAEAVGKGKGVIAVSAHFGNFPLLLIRLQHEGYKTGVILRRMRDEKMEQFLDKKRRESGVNFIYSTPRNICVEQSLKALRNNEIVLIQLDQNFGTGGVFVDFFHRKAATATGPVVFALRAGASVLPVFIIRNEDNTHKIIIEPELIIDKRDNQEETVQVNTQKLTGIIESYIRRYPQEWGWIHRRWKSRPK